MLLSPITPAAGAAAVLLPVEPQSVRNGQWHCTMDNGGARPRSEENRTIFRRIFSWRQVAPLGVLLWALEIGEWSKNDLFSYQ
eukprot:scaffold88074_cov31-Tisochrysis_lutea.AAC.1